MARTGSGTVTSKDVARVAGVSQSTVSYVMSGKRPISARTRRLVEDAIAQLTYQPHAGARALAGARTNVIGLVVPFRTSIGAHGLMSFVEEIALGARAHDYDVLMVTADEGPSSLQRLAGRSLCDAVIVMEVRTVDERLPIARSLGVPALFIGIPADTGGLHCVDFDFEGAAELFVDDLADAGHRRVAVLAWGHDVADRDINYVPRFRRGIDRAAARRGVRTSWHPAEPGREGADRALDAALGAARDDAGELPALVLTSSVPDLANALARRGLTPGVDLDVMALATHEEAEAQPVPLSAISTQPRDVSRRALRTLFRLLGPDVADPDGGPVDEVELVPPAVVHRSSTRPGAAGPPT